MAHLPSYECFHCSWGISFLIFIRGSAHKLRIEDGRYRNIERNNRLCQYCQMNVIEDEFHFLLVCPAYRQIRISVLP